MGNTVHSPAFKHVILTRFNLGLYDRPDADEWMQHRMLYFSETRESVLSQEGDFEWILSMDERTPNRYIQDIVCDSRMAIIHEHPNTYKPDGFTITTRFDNDDLYFPGAIKAIQDCFVEEELVVDLKYVQLRDGVFYTSERPRPNSPFLSLISKEKNCYVRPHTKMINDFKGIFASKEIYACMVIHDRNLANKIIGRKV